MAKITGSLKKKKLPKAPKSTANSATWSRYEKKASEVKKHNDSIESEKNRRQKFREKLRS